MPQPKSTLSDIITIKEKFELLDIPASGDNHEENSRDSSCPEGADETWHFWPTKQAIPGFSMLSGFEHPKDPISK